MLGEGLRNLLTDRVELLAIDEVGAGLPDVAIGALGLGAGDAGSQEKLDILALRAQLATAPHWTTQPRARPAAWGTEVNEPRVETFCAIQP